MSLDLRKTSRRPSNRSPVTHKANSGRCENPSIVQRHVPGGIKALQTLINARELVGLVLDSNGAIAAVGTFDSSPLTPLCDALVGRSLDALVGKNTYKSLSHVLEQAQAVRGPDSLGFSMGANFRPRWPAVLIRTFPENGEGKKLFSMFGCDIVAWPSSQKNEDKPENFQQRIDGPARAGTWQASVGTGELAVSAELLTMLDLPRSGSHRVSEVLWEITRSCGSLAGSETWVSGDPHEPHSNSDGTAYSFYAEVVPLPCSTEPPVRFVATLTDTVEPKAVERNLHDSQCLLAQAEKIANFGSWSFDVNTHKVSWSEQLYELFGLCPWQPATAQFYWDSLHPADRVRVREIADRGIRESKEFSYVARYRLPTGKYRVHYARGVPIRGADGKTARVIGIVHDITERAQVEADLHRLSRELMRARDEERRHMARELHESAGQSLAALKMTLGNLRETLPSKNCLANSLLQTCVDLTNEAVKEVRTISYLMHPPMLDEAGLPSAVRWYARGFAERSKIEVDVDVPDDFGRQPREIETTVFRIIQEALTNVHRYSGSKTAQIRLRRNATEICAEITDQGCGLTQPIHGNGNGQPSGVGIAGMRERIHQLNGAFEIASFPGKGTTVRVVLPVSAGQPSATEEMVNQLDATR